MSKQQLVQSLKDVIPTYSGAFPPQLLSYVDYIYQLSLQKIPVLPNRGEVARYHLCAYIGAERCRDRFNLPVPLQQKIPVQPKVASKLLDDITENVVLKSPSSSPRKRPHPSTPSRHESVPKIGSPLKNLLVAGEKTSESPFLSKSAVESPFMAKLASTEAKTPSQSPVKTPRKLQKSSVPSTPNSPRYLRHLSIADMISFANNFYIPASVTPHIVECFVAEKHKFTKKNEWLLACGLIYAAYTRINHRLIANTIGKKAELQDQLFQYQKGGLMKRNMVTWLHIIEESVKADEWVVDLELKYVHNNWSVEDTTAEKEIEAKLGRGSELLMAFGSMVNASTMFDKESQQIYYDTWTTRLLQQLE